MAKIYIEGEYLNNKENGYIKKYNLDGQIIFEGIYVKGQKNGKRKRIKKKKII